MQALDQHPAVGRIERGLQGAGAERRRRAAEAHLALARGQLDVSAADAAIGGPAQPRAAVNGRIENGDRPRRPRMGEDPRGIQTRGRNLHQGALEAGHALRLHLKRRLADAHVAGRLEPAAGLVEADAADVATPADRSRDFRQHNVAVGEFELLKEADRTAELRVASEVLEEAPEIAGRGPRRAGRCIAQLIAPLRRDTHRGEEVRGGQPARRGAEAEQGAGRQARLEPLGAQHRAALTVGKIDTAELEAQRMGRREPGDFHGADARSPPGRGGGQPALRHRAERAGGDVALRQPPGGEAGDQGQSCHDADHGRRDMSDGWPQQAGIPLPRSLASSPARLCASARRPA